MKTVGYVLLAELPCLASVGEEEPSLTKTGAGGKMIPGGGPIGPEEKGRGERRRVMGGMMGRKK